MAVRGVIAALAAAVALSACAAGTGDVAGSESELVPAAVVVRTGSVAAFVEDASLVASAELTGNQISIEVDGASITVVGVASASPDAPSQVVVGEPLTLNASGLQPESLAEVWLFSTPTFLGSFPVDQGGVLSASFAIDDAVELGQHQLQIRSVSQHGRKVVVALNVSVRTESTSGLQAGTDLAPSGDSEATSNPDASLESSASDALDHSDTEGQQRERAGEQSPSPEVGQANSSLSTDRARAADEAAARERADREAAERRAAERAEEELKAAERAEAERIAAEQAAAERVAAERAEADRRAAVRQAAEADAARRAASDAESEVVAAARTHAEAITQQQAAAVAASSESYCRSRARSSSAAQICPGRGRRAGEEHYEETIGPNTARFEYEFMARDYNAVYERLLRQYLADVG